MIHPLCTGGPSESAIGDPLEVTMAEWAERCIDQGGLVVHAARAEPAARARRRHRARAGPRDRDDDLQPARTGARPQPLRHRRLVSLPEPRLPDPARRRLGQDGRLIAAGRHPHLRPPGRARLHLRELDGGRARRQHVRHRRAAARSSRSRASSRRQPASSCRLAAARSTSTGRSSRSRCRSSRSRSSPAAWSSSRSTADGRARGAAGARPCRCRGRPGSRCACAAATTARRATSPPTPAPCRCWSTGHQLFSEPRRRGGAGPDRGRDRLRRHARAAARGATLPAAARDARDALQPPAPADAPGTASTTRIRCTIPPSRTSTEPAGTPVHERGGFSAATRERGAAFRRRVGLAAALHT